MDTDKHGWQRRKAELRAKIRDALKEISPAARTAASERLCAKLNEQSFFRSAASILFFAPLPDEINIWPLLEKINREKTTALPCFDFNNQFYTSRQVKDLHAEIFSGQFGIREPIGNCVEIPSREIDLVLVPGIVFDLQGHRLGRGKGFYDRLLAEIRGVKCAIAFDEQIVEKIPVEPHDVRMDFILTPTRCAKIEK
jgi:5-formyltetrahydrofolate cyclo-ligase